MNYFPLNYQNEIKYLRKSKIQEYDIRNGGYSITISENLIDDKDVLEELEVADRHQKHIILGNYAKEHKEYTKALHEGFRKYVTAFVTLNGLDLENVLTINKDSVTLFDIPKTIERTKFKKAEFTLRGTWSSYLRLGKLVFYINKDEHLIKGTSIEKIEGTLLEEVLTILRMREELTPLDASKYLKELRQAYVNLELEDSYYRELSALGSYSMKDARLGGDIVRSRYVLDDDPSSLDITYNYNNILVPLCALFAE